MTLLAHIAQASHRRESTLSRRFPRAELQLAALFRDGLIDIHSLKPRSYHVTAAGRSWLRRERDAAAIKGAA